MKDMFSWALAGVWALGSGCGLKHDRSSDPAEQADCRTGRVEIVSDPAAKTPLGFSANSVLSFVEGTHFSEQQWLLPVEAYDPKFASDELTLDVKRGGAVRLRACPLVLEIDVMVRLTSRNGALDERFESVIVAREATKAELHHEFSLDDAFSEFASQRLTGAGAVLTKLELTAALELSHMSGSISAEFEGNVHDAEDAPAVELAVWPPRDFCHVTEPEERGVLRSPVRSDSALADAPVAALNDAGSLSLVWSDGGATSVDLHATQAGVGCMQRHEGGMPVFTYPMKLGVTTHDGRMKARLDGTLWVTSDVDVNQPNIAVLQAKTETHSADELEAETGITGLDLLGYESIALRGSVYYAPRAGMPQGMVVLVGEAADGDECDSAQRECGPTELLEGVFQ